MRSSNCNKDLKEEQKSIDIYSLVLVKPGLCPGDGQLLSRLQTGDDDASARYRGKGRVERIFSRRSSGDISPERWCSRDQDHIASQGSPSPKYHHTGPKSRRESIPQW